MMHKSILIKGGTIVTMDARDSVIEGDVLIREGRIRGVGNQLAGNADVVIDAHNCVVLPGFVQTHVHLCQTLFRGAADDLSLIEWLKDRVWPMEAAHTAKSVRTSAMLGVAELIKGSLCKLKFNEFRGLAISSKKARESGDDGLSD